MDIKYKDLPEEISQRGHPFKIFLESILRNTHLQDNAKENTEMMRFVISNNVCSDPEDEK